MDVSTSGPRRGPYAKSSRQRDEIIEAALAHFGQHGYHGASMREIARNVGLSQAGLLHHFRTKADLLIAVLESRDNLTSAMARAAAAQAEDPLAGLIAVVEDNAARRGLVQMFVVVSAEATDDTHPAHDYFRQRAQQVIGWTRAGLRQAADQGMVRADLDLDLAARQCQALMYGLQVQWLFDPTTDMVALFEALLAGFAPSPPKDASSRPAR
ncbi:MAG TPA: TetR/AcrR family transcriptional regulator [Acidimicrobiales bacterium]|nr:TetR/AcrR family transcriptional regulator [Acidimicrobiales bacterium]